MKKRNKIITVLAAASLTFGVLFATFGERNLNHCNKPCEKQQCHNQESGTSDNSIQQ